MKYNNTNIEIEDVQKTQLEILLEFDRICKKKKIPYQIFSGTLLGAIRHKGFIPWDDDIDVCLLRKDYERFIRCCSTELNPAYFLQDYVTDNKSYYKFAKLRKNHTIFLNSIEVDSGMHNGIYIDIFPLDNVEPDTALGKLQPWIFQFLYIIESSRVKGRTLNTKNSFNRIIRLFFYYILKIVPKNIIDELMQKILKMFEKKETKYVNHLTNGVSKKRLKMFLREKNTFYDVIYKEFEGYNFPVPRNYHQVLKNHYGDYMSLPPKDKRVPHHGVYKVVFDTRENDTIKLT